LDGDALRDFKITNPQIADNLRGGKLMENLMKTFESQEFGKVSVVEISGETWMVGKDIAEALGYKETANMRKLLDAYDYKEIDPQSSEFTGFVQNGSTLEPNKSRG
jgi:prophage antirepressor-like protein